MTTITRACTFIILSRSVLLRMRNVSDRVVEKNKTLNSDSNILIYIQQDATLHSLFYLETAPHVSGGTTSYQQERKQLCLQHLLFLIRSQQASGPAARLLRSWVRIPPGAWIFVCRECRVLSGRGLCDELITRPEESYRPCCVVVCDLETSRIGAPYIYIYIYI